MQPVCARAIAGRANDDTPLRPPVGRKRTLKVQVADPFQSLAAAESRRRPMLSRMSMAAPIVIALSAMLNAG